MSDPENTVAVASAATDKTNVAATDNNEEAATKTGNLEPFWKNMCWFKIMEV